MAHGYTFFQTALGRCGIGWDARGILWLSLPDQSEQKTSERLAARFTGWLPRRPPAWVRNAVTQVSAHLDGKPQAFETVPLVLEGLPAFHRRVYEVMRRTSAGRTWTYGDVAALVGSPGASRAVGQALARNPMPLLIPCHRVIAAGGRAGGFSAFGGVATKARLLALEGVHLGRSLFRGGGALAFDGESAVQQVAASDPELGRLIQRVGPFRLSLQNDHSPFQALAQSIVYQQLAGAAAARIYERVRALFPRGFTPKAVLKVAPEALRAAGLSGSKVLAMKDLAQKAADGVVPDAEEIESLSDEALVERLTTIRGIGRWTVEMLLIFRLGRPDVLPATDYGVRTGFAKAFRKRRLPTPSELLARGERWRPFRTIASWYLWRACELPGKAEVSSPTVKASKNGGRTGASDF